MKGNNTITVTNETMQEAFQEYLNKRTVGDADKVTWITGAAGSKFTINIEERKKETAK